jgi:hypothetical protein
VKAFLTAIPYQQLVPTVKTKTPVRTATNVIRIRMVSVFARGGAGKAGALVLRVAQKGAPREGAASGGGIPPRRCLVGRMIVQLRRPNASL